MNKRSKRYFQQKRSIRWYISQMLKPNPQCANPVHTELKVEDRKRLSYSDLVKLKERMEQCSVPRVACIWKGGIQYFYTIDLNQ